MNFVYLCQDFTSVAALVDLAALRDEVAKNGGDPSTVDSLCPADLVVDNFAQVKQPFKLRISLKKPLLTKYFELYTNCNQISLFRLISATSSRPSRSTKENINSCSQPLPHQIRPLHQTLGWRGVSSSFQWHPLPLFKPRHHLQHCLVGYT